MLLQQDNDYKAFSYFNFMLIIFRVKQHPPTDAALKNLKKLLAYCEDIYMHYRLAYDNKFYDVVNMLLKDAQTGCCLNDMLSNQNPSSMKYRLPLTVPVPQLAWLVPILQQIFYQLPACNDMLLCESNSRKLVVVVNI